MSSLEVAGLEVAYGGVPAVRGVSFDVAPGEIVGLIGPNGAGKSTTLHAIMGARPGAGRRRPLRGRVAAGRAPEAIARRGIALVPEGRRLFAELTVEENLRLGSRRATALGRRGRAISPTWPRSFRSSTSFAGGRPGRSPGASSSSSRSRGPSWRSRPSCSSTSRRSGSRRRSSTSCSRRSRRSASGASGSFSSSSGLSGPSRSPTATHVLANGELRLTLTPDDAADTSRMVAAYLS